MNRSRALITLMAVASFGLMSACEADLPAGTFACASSDECPNGWECRGDDLCYPPSAPRASLYDPCGSDLDCASGSCYFGDAGDDTTGRCTTGCGSDSCPEGADGAEGVCTIEDICLLRCESTSECAESERCLLAPVMITGGMGMMMPNPERACMAFSATVFDPPGTCTDSRQCPLGALCLRAETLDATGLCAWPCNPDSDCPESTTCVELPASLRGELAGGMPVRFACLNPCRASDGGGPDECGGMLSCRAYPDEPEHCVPTGW